MSRRLFCTLGLCLAISSIAAATITEPALQRITPMGNLAGRTDYLAEGGQITLRAPAPTGASVEWFRDDNSLGTTDGTDLVLPSLTRAHTGNYYARWMENGRNLTSKLTPLTVGPLPAGNFPSPNLAAGLRSHPSTFSISQVLPDHRIITSVSSWVGVGQSYARYIHSADLQTSVSFNTSSDAYPDHALLGVLDDGSFFTRSSPYRFSAPNSPLPFNMPSVFAETPATAVTSLDTTKLLLSNHTNLVCAQLDGQVIYARSATNLNLESIRNIVALPSGRVLVYGGISDVTGLSQGRAIELGTDGLPDPTFKAIDYANSAQPQRLNDGTYSALTTDREMRFDQQGNRLTDRPLPADGLPNRFALALNGDLYGYMEGLGVIRWGGSPRQLDPHFFLPQQLESATDLVRIAQRSDGIGVSYAATGVDGLNHPMLTLLQSTTDSTPHLPVMGQEVLIYGEGLYDGSPKYHTFPYNTSDIAPTAASPLRLFCPVYNPAAATLAWVPLDDSLPPEPTADGSFYVPSFSEDYAGRYQLTATNATGRALGPIVDLRPRTAPRLTNLSGRGHVNTAGDNLVAGFVLRPRPESVGQSLESPRMLLRGIGPTLTEFGITSPLPDPWMVLSRLNGPILAQNDDWRDASLLSYSVLNRVGAFTPFINSLDASIYQSLEEGVYTATTFAKASESGIALTEIYIDDTTVGKREQLVNLSLRGNVGSADAAMVAGFVIEDPDRLDRSVRILIRAIGPTLANYGVTQVLSDPQIVLHRSGTEIASNNDWSTSPNANEIASTATAVGAFSLPTNAKDAALIVELPPGNYTATVTGGSGEGQALLELYLLIDE